MEQSKPTTSETRPVLSRCNRDFRKLYEDLPKNLQKEADKSFAHWQNDPDSVQFKPIIVTNGKVWSARVTEKYRAMATKTERNGQVAWIWFWIGTHNQYDTLLKSRLSQKINHLREQYCVSEQTVKISAPIKR